MCPVANPLAILAAVSYTNRRAHPSTRTDSAPRVLGRARLRLCARSWSVSRGVLVIGEDFSDCASSDAGEDGVGALVVGEGDQPDGQCPAATSRPRRVIDRERCAEGVPGLSREEIPRDDQVACGITHAQTPKVDDGADPALLDQQVKRLQVSVDPDGRAVPRWCLKGCVPRRGHCAGIEHAVQGGDCGAGVSVSRGERHAAEGVVRPRERPAAGQL
jgi:hypothetical protein